MSRSPLVRRIAQALFDIPPCADGTAGRACRWCEAEAIAARLHDNDFTEDDCDDIIEAVEAEL